MTWTNIGQTSFSIELATSPALTLPGPPAIGDLVLVEVVHNSGPASGGGVAAGQNYTLEFDSSNAAPNCKFYWKVLTAADTTVTVDAASNRWTAVNIQVVRHTNGVNGTVVDNPPGASLEANQLNLNIADHTSITDDALHCKLGARDDQNLSATIGYPANSVWGSCADNTGQAAGEAASAALAFEIKDPAGLVSGGQFTSGATSEAYWTYHVAFRPATAGGDSITIDDVAAGRVVQRNESGNGSINLTGTYSGPTAPTSIEWRVVEAGTSTEVVTWTVGDASPTGGVYDFIASGIPSGGDYNAQVRSMDGVTPITNADGSSSWYVGALVACIGQSHLVRLFTDGASITPNADVFKFNELGWATVSGDGATNLGNILNDVLGCPIGLLDYAVGGSGLNSAAGGVDGYWLDQTAGEPRALFLTGVDTCTEGDNQIEAIAWAQGGADASVGVTKTQYGLDLIEFWDNVTTGIRALIKGKNSSGTETLPILFIPTGRRVGATDSNWQAIREAQTDYIDADGIDSHNISEFGRPLVDSAHLTVAGYTELGADMAVGTLYYTGDLTNPAQNPAVTGATGADGSATLTLTFDQDLNLIDTVMDLEGWRVTESAVPATVSDVTRTGTRTVDITLATSVTAIANVLITGKYGVGTTDKAILQPRAAAKTLPGSLATPSPLFLAFYDLAPVDVGDGFPVVLERLTQQHSVRATSQAVNLGASYALGDLAIIQITGQFVETGDFSRRFDTPAGWTSLDQADGNPSGSSRYTSAWFAREMDGTEGGTSVTFTIEGAQNFTAASQVRQIQVDTWYGNIASGNAISIVSSGTDSAPDSPALTVPWGVADTLWLTGGGAADDDQEWTVAPLNYTDRLSVVSGAGIDNGCSVGVAERKLAAATEDPGAWTLAGTESWRCWTVAVRPFVPVTQVHGSGDFLASAALMSGLGHVLTPSGGSGAFLAQAATFSGTGHVLHKGQGDLLASNALMGGIGHLLHKGSGSLVVSAATMQGLGIAGDGWFVPTEGNADDEVWYDAVED